MLLMLALTPYILNTLMKMTERDEPEYEEVADEKALEICNDIKLAAKYHTLALEVGYIAAKLSSNAAFETMFKNLPYSFLVNVPETQKAIVVSYDDVIEEQPASFVATEFRGIGNFGTEFYNAENDTWLKIDGYEFEVRPIESPEE